MSENVALVAIRALIHSLVTIDALGPEHVNHYLLALNVCKSRAEGAGDDDLAAQLEAFMQGIEADYGL